MPWGAVAGGLISGVLGSMAASDAAGAQTAATNAGIGEQRRQFDLTRSDFAPYRQIGLEGLQTLADYLGLKAPATDAPVMPNREQFTTTQRTRVQDPSGYQHLFSYQNTPVFDATGYNMAMDKYLADKAAFDASQTPSENFGTLLRPFTGDSLTSEPGYQFGLSEGEKAIERAMRARGSFDSGPALKALLRFNEDYAGTKYNDAFNRDSSTKQRIYNMLAGISGTGQTATGQVASAGTNATNNITQLLGDQGNARAAGIVGGANAWNNAISQGMNYYQNQNMLKYLRGNTGYQGMTMPDFGPY